MGAEYYEGHGLSNKHAADAFNELAEMCAYEYGHGGYTGTFAETPGCILLGKLPPRVSSAKFAELCHQQQQVEWNGYWAEHIKAPKKEGQWFQDTIRTIKHRKVQWPKSMRTTQMTLLINKFIDLSDMKWEPAAAVECNAVETRKYKKHNNKQGTRGKLYYFAATCSS